MQYDLGYFDHETYRLDPIEKPFSVKVLPRSPAVSVKIVVAALVQICWPALVPD